MEPDQEILTGGGVNEVVRIGATVRRPTGFWSPLVHGLLRHLQSVGFTAAPTLHEVTADSFEILEFLPGEVCNYPVSEAAASPEALESAARLLRSYHDHTIGYLADVLLEGWQLPAGHPLEVICHGDFAPHNVVLQGRKAFGIIDFDTAHPGSRLEDVAYAVYRWAPITAPDNADGFGTTPDQAARTKIFCDRYELDDTGRAGLVDAVILRLNALVDFMRARAAEGNTASASHLAAGHHRQYLADAAYLENNREAFTSSLFE